jgi:hypothetical protein
MKITIFAGDGRRVFLLLVASICASMIGGTAIAQNEGGDVRSGLGQAPVIYWRSSLL